MTTEEMATLKDQIKAEVLREIGGSCRHKATENWSRVKEEAIFPRLQQYGSLDQYKIMLALSTIIRYKLGVNRIAYLSADQVDRAKEIAARTLDVMLPQDAEGRG